MLDFRQLLVCDVLHRRIEQFDPPNRLEEQPVGLFYGPVGQRRLWKMVEESVCVRRRATLLENIIYSVSGIDGHRAYTGIPVTRQ